MSGTVLQLVDPHIKEFSPSRAVRLAIVPVSHSGMFQKLGAALRRHECR